MSYTITFAQAVAIFEMMGFSREFYGHAGYIMVNREHGLVMDVAKNIGNTDFSVKPVEGESYLDRYKGETDLQYIDRMYECAMIQVNQ